MGQPGISNYQLPATTHWRLERETGIGPASLAWKARVLPLNYSRIEAEPVNPKTPQNSPFVSMTVAKFNLIHYAGGEGWIRTIVLVRGQIYSLLPLTTRPPLLLVNLGLCHEVLQSHDTGVTT